MTDETVLASRWGGRPESASRCAERLALFLTGLGALHPGLRDWDGLVGDDESVPPESWPLRPEPAELEPFVRACDEGGRGFRLVLMSPSQDKSLSVDSGRDGMSGIDNSAFLWFREPAGTVLQDLGPEVVEGLLEAVAGAWEPEWATFIGLSAWEAESGWRRSRPTGLATYVAGSPAEILAEVPGLAVRKLGRGTLLTRPWAG
ncbi:Imm52 family immunity protein [Streptomyces sp. NPDC007971]|uniref:Imm52 family immunity protein n=1 Tax=Streptomyces sp. NPDC007971 TaxID=3364799 RepID=UPI0036EEB2FD